LDVVRVNFESTALHVLRYSWLFRVPPGVPKVCWSENRTSPPRAAHITQSVARRASQSDLLIDNGKY
jgi:hypothetical protein